MNDPNPLDAKAANGKGKQQEDSKMAALVGRPQDIGNYGLGRSSRMDCIWVISSFWASTMFWASFLTASSSV